MVCVERDIGLGGERYRSSETLTVMVCPVFGGERYRSSRTLAMIVCPVLAERDTGHQEP